MTSEKTKTVPSLTSFSSKLKRQLDVRVGDNEEDYLTITPLGAGNEVGRSCIILKFRGKQIMLDSGIHPAYEGISGLPFFDSIDPSEIDLVLISHFHLDHAASLPYFMEKTSFEGPVYMTHPTKAIYKWFLTDYVRVSTLGVDDMLFDEQDLLRSYEKINVMDYHQQVEVNGIKFTSYNAGHVLGAAMFLIEIGGIQVLYTGDYSREEDRHLMAAECPSHISPSVLICEATYGNQVHEPRDKREARFTGGVHSIVARGGKCLIPVFALGRAQELLLILDEYWQNHPELDQVPIYFASSLAKKCMAVYQTYINMMNDHIRHQFTISNPFIFKHISNLRHLDTFDDSGPCVMVASPGMLQNGLSRKLFEKWCPDPKNGLMLCGYSVEGTLARTILTSPETVTSLSGGKLPVRMSVEYVSFSAHVDFQQNAEFIEMVSAPHLVLVHGEPIPMSRLRAELVKKYLDPRDPAAHAKIAEMAEANPDSNMDTQPLKLMAIHTPRNTETVRLHFKSEKVAKIMGRLAEEASLEPGSLIQGVLVGKDATYTVLHPDDLPDLAGLETTSFVQTQTVPFPAKFSLLRKALAQMLGRNAVQVTKSGLEVMKVVTIQDFTGKSIDPKTLIQQLEQSNGPNATEQPHVVLEWLGSETNDMVADGILAAILSLTYSPAAVKMSSIKCDHIKAEDHSHGCPDAIETADEPTDVSSPPPAHLKALALDKVVQALDDAFDLAQLLDTPPTIPCTDAQVIKVQVDGHDFYVDVNQLQLIAAPDLASSNLPPLTDLTKFDNEVQLEEVELNSLDSEEDRWQQLLFDPTATIYTTTDHFKIEEETLDANKAENGTNPANEVKEDASTNDIEADLTKITKDPKVEQLKRSLQRLISCLDKLKVSLLRS